eukprot:NODE_1190_length_1613_cov_60.008748_g1121_i0.p1 GENE.NODE_1190_length_1613_cov_60.008748_g1121_i0~~NODE_1190_length_1613_cov_60.008748_g1121_i0.p1  ORF type:complete len:495 (+),score=107.39 NODE_1190_length_1613_cov_60.008748_g1121_i0:59-1543(+)
MSIDMNEEDPVRRAIGIGLCAQCTERITGTLPTSSSDTVCPVCFGLLAPAEMNHLTEQVLQTHRDSDYVTEHYSVALTFPRCMALRQVTAVLHVLRPSPADSLPVVMGKIKDIKDVLQTHLRTTCTTLGTYLPDQGLLVSVEWTHPKGNEGFAFLSTLPERIYTPPGRSPEISTTVIKEALSRMTVHDYHTHHPDPLEGWHLDQPATLALRLSHSAILLMGRYVKLQRGLAQTPWVLNGERKTKTSVQELIALSLLQRAMPTVDLAAAELTEYNASDPSKKQRIGNGHCKGKFFNCYANSEVDAMYKFHSCGREDIDVRMLGCGRPFVVEVLNPHHSHFTPEQLLEMTASVNQEAIHRVQISHLHLASKAEFDSMNTMIETKAKTYRCVAWVSCDLDQSTALLNEINQRTDISVEQKTPIRVLHRRTVMTREKTIHSIHCKAINTHWLLVDVTTSSGMYVKEFIHSDFGRTTPSLGDLLKCRAEIIQLDVLDLV